MNNWKFLLLMLLALACVWSVQGNPKRKVSFSQLLVRNSKRPDSNGLTHKSPGPGSPDIWEDEEVDLAGENAAEDEESTYPRMSRPKRRQGVRIIDESYLEDPLNSETAYEDEEELEDSYYNDDENYNQPVDNTITYRRHKQVVPPPRQDQDYDFDDEEDDEEIDDELHEHDDDHDRARVSNTEDHDVGDHIEGEIDEEIHEEDEEDDRRRVKGEDVDNDNDHDLGDDIKGEIDEEIHGDDDNDDRRRRAIRHRQAAFPTAQPSTPVQKPNTTTTTTTTTTTSGPKAGMATNEATICQRLFDQCLTFAGIIKSAEDKAEVQKECKNMEKYRSECEKDVARDPACFTDCLDGCAEMVLQEKLWPACMYTCGACSYEEDSYEEGEISEDVPENLSEETPTPTRARHNRRSIFQRMKLHRTGRN